MPGSERNEPDRTALTGSQQRRVDASHGRRTAAGALTSRIGRRFVLLFAGCALLPLVAFATLAVNRVSTQLHEDVRNSLHNAAKTAGMGISARLSQAAGDLALAVELINSSRVEGLFSDRTRFQRQVQDHADGVWLYEGNRTERLAGEGAAPDVTFTPKQQAHLNSGRTLVQVFGPAREIVMTVELDPEDTTDDRISLLIRPAWVFDPQVLRGANCEFAVCDSHGNVLYDTFPDLSEGDVLRAGFQRDPTAGSIEWVVGGEDHVARYWRAFLEPQYSIDFLVVQSRSQVEAYDVQATFLRWFLLTAAATLLVVILISLVQLRRTLDPILTLRDATDAVGSGNLDQRVSIESDDEFGELGNAFNKMTESLQLNIAERERTEVKLVESRDEALAAARAKAEFVTNVSHEFRTPMAEILSAVEIMDGLGDADGDAEARDEFQGIALHGAKRLSQLLDDVLELGRAPPTAFAAVDLAENIWLAIGTLPEDWRARVRCELVDLPPVRGDASSMSEVWRRLLDNACKFSAEDSMVDVRARLKDDQVVVEIADHGAGIAIGDLQRVFDPFVQVGRDQMTNKANGTGLGLTLAKSAVEMHGGQLHLSSKLGVGTTFRVRFPVWGGADAGLKPEQALAFAAGVLGE
ncbi:MAG: sensor histidine kinase [Planctomycetota bacterium]